MRFSINILLSLVPLYSHLSQARPQGAFTFVCDPATDYDKSEEKDVSGKPFQLPVSCTPNGNDGCTVGSAESYTVGITITIGGGLSLNIPVIGSLSASASISKTETKGTTDTASGNCKGPWACSAIITPTMVQISGLKKSFSIGDCERDEHSDPYTVQFPKVGSDKIPVINLEVCACTNKKHWADEGAPRPCLEAC